MAREADTWTQQDVQNQLAVPGPWEVSVGGVPGLVLRRGAHASTYALIGRLKGETRQRKWTVAGSDLALLSVRARALNARDIAMRGEDPRPWLDEQIGRVSVPKPVKAVADDLSWKWSKAVSEYLVREVTSKAAATQRDYRLTLTHPDVLMLAERLDGITAERMQSLQNHFADQGKRVMSRHVVVIVKGCLRWCSGRPESGFTRTMLRDATDFDLVRMPKKSEDEKEARVPTLDQVSRVMWRLNDLQVPANVRLACALLVLTGQRVAVVLGAEAEHLVGTTWRIPAVLMKSKESHSLPLPPVALACFRSMAQMVGGGGLLLPQVRLRREGDAGGKPLSYSVLRDAMHDALGHTPHAVRRAMATHGEEEVGISEADLAAVLDHTTGTVTRRFYAHGERMAVMKSVLERWEAFAIQRMLDAGGQEWPAFLPRPLT